MRIICLLTLSLFCAIAVYAQKNILLHMAYLPDHVYDQSVTQKFHMVLTYNGSDSFLHTLKEKGISNPETSDRETVMNALIHTGKYNNKNVMPVQLEFTRAEDKAGNMIIPKGTTMTGTIAKNSMPVYDSVISSEMDTATKAAFLKAFKNILSQIFLPDKRMRIGDTLTVATPLSFPVGPVVFKMIFTTTYKLLNTDGMTAHFSIDLKYTMASEYKGSNTSGGGQGKGIMVIDLKNGYPLKLTSDYTMDLTSAKNDGSIHLLMTGNSDSENIITRK